MGWKKVCSDISYEELIKKAKKTRDGRLRIRIQAIALLTKDKKQKEVAEALGISIRAIRNWIDRYNAEGIDGFNEKPRSGAPVKLKNIDGFRDRVVKGPLLRTDGLVTWSGGQLRKILNKEFQSEYSLSGVYNLLHRLNLSRLSPRPRHPYSNPEEQEAFKKTLVSSWQR